MSRLLPPKRVVKKPPPDDEANLRGRLIGLRSRLRRNARAMAETDKGYEKILAGLTKKAEPVLHDLRARLAKIQGRRASPPADGDLLETLKAL